MPTGSEQSKRISYDDIAGLDEAQRSIRNLIATDPDKTALTRLGIVTYELGSVMRMLVYRKVLPISSKAGTDADLMAELGDAMANIIALSDILGFSTAGILNDAILRLENKEFRRH